MSAPFQTFSLAELEALDFPPVEWIVDELVPAAVLMLLVGRPKAGKSLFELDMAASVAAGDTFLDRATMQGPALYIPAEDSLSLVRSRLFTRLPEDRDIPLDVLPADGYVDQAIRLDEPESFGRLIATIEAIKPALVVLDPFRELHHRKENDADEMAALLRPLRQLAHDSGAAIVLIHHRNKHATDASLATRGSSAIAGSVDVVMTLDTSGSDDESFTPDQVLTITVEGRYGPKQRIGARLRAGLRWESTDPRMVGTVNVKEKIQRYLESTGEQPTADELADALSVAKKTVQNEIKPLCDERRVVRLGTGRKGDPYRYASPQMPFGTNAGTNVSPPESGKQPIRPDSQEYTRESGGTIPAHQNGTGHCNKCGGPVTSRGLCRDYPTCDGYDPHASPFDPVAARA